jgi:MFS family permease
MTVRQDEASDPTPGMRMLLLVVFAPFAFAYFISFLLRNINSVVFPELVQEFALGPGALGFLTSAYFLAFASCQLPLGLLLDRFGPRRVNAALLLLAASGTILFGLAHDFSVLVTGRALMGIGFAACLMSSMTALVLWFPRARMASLSGAMVAIGACGALSATKPVELALRVVPWRSVFLFLGCAVVVSLVVLMTVVPEKRRTTPAAGFSGQLRGLRTILTDGEFWRIGLLAALVQANGLSVLGLWAGPWLRDVAGLPRPEIAQVLLFAAAGFGAGALLLGMLSDRLARRGVDPHTTFIVACAGAALALLGLTVGSPSLSILVLPIFTACSAAGTLGFSLLTARYPPEMAGRALTALNTLTMGAAFAFQWGVGAVLNFWPAADGRYAAAGYQAGFGMLLALLAAALLNALLRARRA